MAKSLRSKQKNAARRKRRSETHYAAASKNMYERLSAKLLGPDAKGKGKASAEDAEDEDEEMDAEDDAESASGKKVSTSGPRSSGRDMWRARKGLKTKHGIVVLPAEDSPAKLATAETPATAAAAGADDDAEMDTATTKAERKSELRRQENAKKMMRHKRKMAALDGGVFKTKGFRPHRRK